MSPVCCFCTERGKARPDTAVRRCGWREGVAKRLNREAVSTVAGRAGGPARSSAEAPAGRMGVERRGRVICGVFVRSTGSSALGRSRMDELKPSGKPFDISKWEVWEAYRQVKANQGAPGVDGVTLEEFEKDLKNNLYKIWNRMSSGSYFPPPVKAVEIPKPHGGGTRILGVPTVADRVAQTVVARRLEAKVEPIFHPDSYGYRPWRSALDAVAVCRERCWKTDWVIDLDIQKFFDSVDHDSHGQGGGGPHRCSVGGAVCEAVADRAAGSCPTGRLQQRDRGTPQGSAVSPVLANLFMHYAFDAWMAREYPGHPVRALCRRRGRALRHRTPGPQSGGRRSGTGWNRSGCGCIPTRPRSCTARTANGGGSTTG